jgi:hypothetical protein
LWKRNWVYRDDELKLSRRSFFQSVAVLAATASLPKQDAVAKPMVEEVKGTEQPLPEHNFTEEYLDDEPYTESDNTDTKSPTWDELEQQARRQEQLQNWRSRIILNRPKVFIDNKEIQGVSSCIMEVGYQYDTVQIYALGFDYDWLVPYFKKYVDWVFKTDDKDYKVLGEIYEDSLTFRLDGYQELTLSVNLIHGNVAVELMKGV